MVAVSPAFLGTLPGWITAASTLTGLFYAILRFGLRWRDQSLGAEANIRDHYAKEVAALREQVMRESAEFTKVEQHLRAMIQDSDRRHEECESSRRIMRREIDDLHAELRGLKLQVSQYSADKLVELEQTAPPGEKPSDKAPLSVEAAQRVKDIGAEK